MGQIEGWHEVLRDRQIEPLYEFPGDDLATGEYTSAVYNWYTEKLSMFQVGAEACGLELSDANLERGRRVVAAACWLDEYLDQPSPSREGRVKTFINGTQTALKSRSGDWLQEADHLEPALAPRPELRNAMRLMATATTPESGFDHTVRRRNILRAHLIGNSALRKGEIQTRGLYARQLVQEADATANIISGAFLDGPPESLAEKQWGQVVRRLMRGIVLVDCGMDLPADRREGRAGVPPTAANRLWLAAQGVSETVITGGHQHDLTIQERQAQAAAGRRPGDLSILLRMAWQHHRLSRQRLHDPITGARAPALPLPSR